MKRRDFLRLTAGLAIGAPLASAIASQDLSEQSLEALCSLVERKRLGLYPNKLVVPQALADRARGILARQEWRMEHRRQRFAGRLDEFVAWIDANFDVTDGPPRAWFEENGKRVVYETVSVGAVLTAEQLEDGRADHITAKSALLRAIRADWENVRKINGRLRLVWRTRPVFAEDIDEWVSQGVYQHRLRMRVAAPDLSYLPFGYVKPESAPVLNLSFRHG